MMKIGAIIIIQMMIMKIVSKVKCKLWRQAYEMPIRCSSPYIEKLHFEYVLRIRIFEGNRQAIWSINQTMKSFPANSSTYSDDFLVACYQRTITKCITQLSKGPVPNIVIEIL